MKETLNPSSPDGIFRCGLQPEANNNRAFIYPVLKDFGGAEDREYELKNK